MLFVSPSAPPSSLLEALRSQLALEGGAPSRRKLALLIEAGAARVDGRVLRDPAAPVPPGARLSFDVEEVEPSSLGAARPKVRAPLPAGVLFADPQLVVIERSAFASADGLPLAAEVAARLGREVLHVVRDPSSPGAGPVLLAGSKAAAKHLEESLDDGRTLETLLSLRTPPQAGPGEAILERATLTEAGRSVPYALLRRDEAPPAPPPPGSRHLAPPQRLALVLKHPRTNRRLAFEVSPSQPFVAACARMGLSGGPGA